MWWPSRLAREDRRPPADGEQLGARAAHGMKAPV
jgi:hypothetical protein